SPTTRSPPFATTSPPFSRISPSGQQSPTARTPPHGESPPIEGQSPKVNRTRSVGFLLDKAEATGTDSVAIYRGDIVVDDEPEHPMSPKYIGTTTRRPSARKGSILSIVALTIEEPGASY